MINSVCDKSFGELVSEKPVIEKMIYKPDALLQAWCRVREQNMCVLLLPPDPARGGTISNSTLRVAENAFGKLGFTTLRINFRGVGMSRGNSKGRGLDLQDALHALDWLSTRHGDPKMLWVGGFGYGAHIAINVAMRRPGVQGFVAITPYAENNEFNVLTPCPNGIVIVGSNDKVASVPTMEKIATELTNQKGCRISCHKVEGANHNYSKHQEDLAKAINEYVNKIISAKESKTKSG